MDHHFIDLLLDQVVRGNRIGHLFPTQAWIEMVSSLNAKFGTQYDKEVLKNRYNQLKQHHSDVNVCLNNKGFSWSGREAMVKDRRDAESYKFKTASIYHKLCVIYGKEGLTGRFRCMDDKVNPKEEDIGCNEHDNYSRTDWTPAMDRCLIDLMLNQVHKGHETNHISSERAWIDIFALFNDRFGPGVDKFVLMDQFKSLRKLYNDMKNLLERSEFSWDESQQMVIASDDVWDAYIKEYLDGNSFRTKSKPSYNDLSAIYGNSTLKTRGNRSVQDVGFNGDGWGFESSRNGDWTASKDRYFIDLMLEQMRRGSMIDQKFNEGAWSYMVGKFNSKFGPRHDEDTLKNHYKKIRKQFGVMKSLLDQNGFTWDETQQRIKAKDDLWEAYIQEDPSARAYKNRTLPNYNDLILIYGNANTNRKCNSSSLSIDFADDGLGVNIGQDDNLSSAGSDTPEICWAKPMKHQHSAMYKDEYLENYTNFSNALNMGRDGMFGGLQSPDSRDSELSHRRKKRRRSATPLTSTYSRKIKKTSEDELGDSGRSKTLEKIYGSIESIVDALQAIPGMDDELFLDACNLLEDEKKAKAFVKMDIKPRKKWLLRQLGR